MRRWLGVFLAIPFALHAGGFALSGVGTRALGMGGAARAVVTDWSAVYWNPARLALAPSGQFGGVVTVLGPDIRYEPRTGLYYYDGGYSLRYAVRNKEEYTPVPSFGLTLTPGWSRGWNLGAGFFVPFGLGGKYDLFDLPLGYESNEPYPVYDWQSKISTLVGALGVARNFEDFQVGLAFGVAYTSVELRQPVAVLSDPRLPVQYSHFFVDEQLSGSGVHGYAAGGISYTGMDRLSVGLSFQYYTDPTLDGNVDLALYTPNNPTLRDALLAQAQTAEDSAKADLFLGNVLRSTATGSVKLPLPWMVGFGVAYQVTPQLRLAYDLSYTAWSRMKELVLHMQGNDPLGEPLDSTTLAMNWKNTLRHSVGFEYQVNPALMVRMGLYYDPTPISSGTLTPLIPDHNTKTSLNLGLSYVFSPAMALDLHYERVLSGSTTHNGLQDVNGDGTTDNMPGVYELTVNAWTVGLRYGL